MPYFSAPLDSKTGKHSLYLTALLSHFPFHSTHRRLSPRGVTSEELGPGWLASSLTPLRPGLPASYPVSSYPCGHFSSSYSLNVGGLQGSQPQLPPEAQVHVCLHLQLPRVTELPCAKVFMCTVSFNFHAKVSDPGNYAPLQMGILRLTKIM